MYQHENLWIKISDDFHAEINPILEQLSPEVINHYWFKKRSIQGKFFIVDNVLLSLNGTGTNQYSLIKLKNTLEAFKTRIKSYFDTHNFATCFVYIKAENIEKTKKYFKQFEDYFVSADYYLTAINSCFMFPVDFVPFPNDCSYKLAAKTVNNKITVERKDDPLFDVEKQHRELMGNIERTRTQQYQIEINIQNQNPELWKRAEEYAMNNFRKFAQKTHDENIQLLENFDRCINLCNTLIDKQKKDTTPANLPEIKKIYSTLKNGYIQEPFEIFTAIFQPEYSGQKIIWLKSGPELKYFVDRMNDKLNLTNRINKWTDSRFELKNQPEHLPKYLTRQKTEGTIYQLLLSGNDRKNPLYKLFREL